MVDINYSKQNRNIAWRKKTALAILKVHKESFRKQAMIVVWYSRLCMIVVENRWQPKPTDKSHCSEIEEWKLVYSLLASLASLFI